MLWKTQLNDINKKLLREIPKEQQQQKYNFKD